MASKLICAIVLLIVCITSQAYPMFPYGPYGYPAPYGMPPPYPYGMPLMRSFDMGGVPAYPNVPVVPAYHSHPGVPGYPNFPGHQNVPGVGGQPIESMQRTFDEFMRSMNRMYNAKPASHDVVEAEDKIIPEPKLRSMPKDLEVPVQQETPQFREVPENQELPADKIKTPSQDNAPEIEINNVVPKMRTVSTEESKDAEDNDNDAEELKEDNDAEVSKEDNDAEVTKEDNDSEEQVSKGDTPIQARTLNPVSVELGGKEMKGNTLELGEEYDQNRERDTEWDQVDYDNFDWEDNNDIDEIKVYNKYPKKSIDLTGDTYVNDLLAAKGAQINPDAEFIPPRTREEDEGPHQRRQPSYHGDTNVNNILASRNTPVNPDAEFIPPSSKYSTPIDVHYGYEIDDYNNPDLTRDTEVNNILAARGAPTNPQAEMIFPSYKGGEYSGDTYVNEIAKKEGTPVNPDAELFAPEQEVIEFVPLGTRKFYQ